MAITNLGPFDWSASRDDDGHREYRITHKVITDDPYQGIGTGGGYAGDGPKSISGAAGLPAIGDPWSYGNDSDVWAICHPQRRIRPVKEDGGAVQVYLVDSFFTTKPLERCMTDEVGDPLLEPQRVRGGSIRYSIEAFKDRNGNPIMSSSHEMFRGPQVEFDGNRSQVIIEQNVADLELSLCTSLQNTLNDDVLWGLAARRIKLSDFQWEELWYGTCIFYYKRVFVFDIRNNPGDLFDRTLTDEGTKVLNGSWVDEAECLGTGVQGGKIWVDAYICGAPPDNTNPQHFNRYKDRRDENARVILDGKGRPADSIISLGTGSESGTGTDTTDPAGQILVEYYNEEDLTQLNIPPDLDFGTATP